MAVNNNKNNIEQHSERVREKLLDAAGELFAVGGFSGASVRQITAKAGCNIAAVNYHFGGKDNLYLEVFRRQLRDMTGRRVEVIDKVMSGTEGEVNLQALLRKFGQAFLEPLIEDSSTNRLMQLFIKEMHEQRLPKKVFMEEVAGPTLRSMREAMSKFCPSLSDQEIVFCIISVIGQLVHLIHIRQWGFSNDESAGFVVPDVSQWIEHVVKFSTAGIKSYSKDGE